jgi:hypothetical protein
MTPSIICRRIPPTAPPTTGLPFHIASVTVNPNPSRSDFCTTTVATRLYVYLAEILHYRGIKYFFGLEGETDRFAV